MQLQGGATNDDFVSVDDDFSGLFEEEPITVLLKSSESCRMDLEVTSPVDVLDMGKACKRFVMSDLSPGFWEALDCEAFFRLLDDLVRVFPSSSLSSSSLSFCRLPLVS